MNLDADAEAFLAELVKAMPRPVNELGLQAGRDMKLAGSAPAGPDLPEVRNITIPGDGGPIGLRVYKPSLEPDLPVLVYMHGGGWSIGSIESVDALCRTMAELAGCAVVSVDYRQAPEHPFPAPLDDVYAALVWVCENGSQIGVDGSRLAVGGDSAGANLAAAATVRARDCGGPSISFQLLAYPPTEYGVMRPSMLTCAHAPVLTAEDVEWFWNLYLPRTRDQNDPWATPKSSTTKAGLPRAFVITAEHDPLRDDAEDYAQTLVQAGVTVASRRYTGVYHGFFPLVGLLEKADLAAAEASAQLSLALRLGSAVTA